MKYIDTSTYESLKRDVMQFLNLTEENLKSIYASLLTEDNEQEWVEKYIENMKIEESLDYIQFFHLTRRLNGSNIVENNNLEQLLLHESPLSDFFKRYNITFRKNGRHIDMYHNDELKILDDQDRYERGNVSYLRLRLGYNDNQDYCVNGLAFRTNIENNGYFRPLRICPEFVEQVGELIDNTRIAYEYRNNSKYYCIEYLIPLSDVIIDGYKLDEPVQNKIIVFLSKSIVKLYDYWLDDIKNIISYHDDNLVLRLSDDANINPEWVKNIEEIPDEKY